jgi:hypothetical protein
MWEFQGDLRLVAAAYYAGDRWIGQKQLSGTGRSSVTDQLQRHMLTRLGRYQQVRLRRFLGDRFHVDVLRLALIVLGLEGARTSQDHRCDFFRHTNRRLKLRPQMQRCHITGVDCDGGDARADRLVGRVKVQWKQDGDRNYPTQSHCFSSPLRPCGRKSPHHVTASHRLDIGNDVGIAIAENTPPDLDIDLLDSVLLEAIASTYKRCSAKTSNPVPLFGDLAAELAHWQDRDRNQKINAMAQMTSTKLRAWVDEGPYARLFDRPTTVQLNNPWLYFNVEKLKDDPRLERAMSLLIAHTATYRASGFTGQPSIVLLDECWALLESPILASVVVQLFRTARKRNASVWGISQTPEDFVGTPDRPNEHGAGIVKNATTKIIGKQPGDMTALRDHVHLNETALNQIKTFAHPKKGHSAEFLIAVGEKAESTHAIRIVPSAVDYWITTTYARERLFRRWWLIKHQQISRTRSRLSLN